MLNMCFASKSVIDDSNKALPIAEPLQHALESIIITTHDVLDVFMPPKELWEAYSNRTVRPSVRQSVRLSCLVHISYIL